MASKNIECVPGNENGARACQTRNKRDYRGIGHTNVGAAVNEDWILGLRVVLVDGSQLVVHALGQEELEAVVSLVGEVGCADIDVDLGRMDEVSIGYLPDQIRRRRKRKILAR